MKKIYSLISWLVILFFSTQLSYSQFINSVSYAPNPALECSTLNVTVNGDYICANFTINSAVSFVSGSSIFVDIDFNAPLICLPAIVPFPTQIVNAGMVPAGSYTLVVRTYNNGILNTNASMGSSQPITIGSCCAADPAFTAANATTVCIGDSVTFTAATFGQGSYNWKLNNVSFSTDSVSGQTFNQVGTYDIKLVVDNAGCSDSLTQTITVTDFPQLTILNVIGESCPGVMDGAVALGVSGGTPAYSYSWSNGAMTQNLSQLGGGTYQVWVTDNTGCMSTDSATVQTGSPVTSDFTSDLTSPICPGDSANFTNISVGGITYEWQVNGQSISTNMNSNYVFADTGSYEVMLLASNATCTDSFSINLSVIAPSIAATVTDENCDNAGNGMISLGLAGGTAPYMASWSTGATTTNIDQLDDGDYTVWITDNMGCISADTISVGTGNITPDIVATATDESCANAGNGNISLSLSGGLAPYTVSWSTGAMTTSIDSLDNGFYTAFVTDSLGCESMQLVSVGTSPGFEASFMADTSTQICPGTNISFTNTSLVGTSYDWLNSDTIFAQTMNSDFTFAESGVYDIVLVANDGICSDSAEIAVTVFDLPTVAETLTHPLCPGDANGQIELTVSGVGSPYTYLWSTGNTMKDINELTDGTYTVEILDNNGCTSTDTFELVTQGGITAGFSWSNQTDSSTAFIDTSNANAASWSWDFGDGTPTSNAQNPVHFYQFNGSFNVCLAVVDSFGCMDTICDVINIALAIDKENLHPLRIYPNPTEGMTTIDLSSYPGKKAEIKVFDITGRLIEGHTEIVSGEMDLNLSYLPNGIYTILVKIDDQFFRTRLIKE